MQVILAGSIFIEIEVLVIIIIFISLLGITFFRKQFLIILLSLEIRALNIFIVLFWLFIRYNQHLSSALYMLIIVVCEASLGLSLLVVLTRAKGNDNLLFVGLN